jgi:hypothetical protein
MTDPFEGLVSFQQALLNGEIRLQRGKIHPDVFLHVDYPRGDVPRFTYVRLDGQEVTAFANMAPAGLVHDLPCFQVGVAVPEVYRGRGYAKGIVAAAIAELRNGLLRNNIRSFYVEAVVSVDNEPSKRVARSTISSTSTDITDEVSGLPALRYLRKIEKGNSDDARGY